jgi:hypothetical protein
MSTMNNLSPWKGVLSGTGAAILANVLVYPLDMYSSNSTSYYSKPAV